MAQFERGFDDEMERHVPVSNPVQRWMVFHHVLHDIRFSKWEREPQEPLSSPESLWGWNDQYCIETKERKVELTEVEVTRNTEYFLAKR